MNCTRCGISAFFLGLLVVSAAQAQTTWYVDDATDPAEDGSVDHPFDTIQEAIDASTDGDTVLALDGAYTGPGNKNLDFSNGLQDGTRAIVVRSASGPAACVIDCQGDGRAFNFHSGETYTSIVDGFTITNGNTDGGGAFLCDAASPWIANCRITGNSVSCTSTQSCGGGGIRCVSSAARITDCIFETNVVTITSTTSGHHGGGGLHCYASDVEVENCTFNANSVSGSHGPYGGAVFYYYGESILRGCAFSGNSAEAGGAIFHQGASGSTSRLRVEHCTFTSNEATGHGGGLFNNDYIDTTFDNCFFHGNSAGMNGGAVVNNAGSSVDLTNCTLTGNTAGGEGGGIYNTGGSTATLVNCILWDNSPQQISGQATATHSDIQLGWAGVGNIDADPLFVDADGPDDVPGTEDDNMRLSPGSPCIDAGDDSAVTVSTDLDGNPRILDRRPGTENDVDMGAYEYNGVSIPTVSEWGLIALAAFMVVAGAMVLRKRTADST